jgi:hypothetical protein
MFADQVLSENGYVLFEGTPEEVKEFLEGNDLFMLTINKGCYVIQGHSKRAFWIEEYLKL